MPILDFIGLFIFIAGFIIGLGSVTVIDIHGFLGRKSSYWTEATTRTHKVTKPLIWVGITLTIIGGVILYQDLPLSGIPLYHVIIATILILNGLFLSFHVSPFLIKQELLGQQTKILPNSLQRKIMVSLILSDISWWGGLALLIWHVVQKF